MQKAKKKATVVQAYRLGEESDMVEELTAEGEIKLRATAVLRCFPRRQKTGRRDRAYRGLHQAGFFRETLSQQRGIF